MAYRNKVYVSMDADNDLRYYFMMKAWKQNDNSSLIFMMHMILIQYLIKVKLLLKLDYKNVLETQKYSFY